MDATTSRSAIGEPGDARQVRSRRALTAALLTLLEEYPFDQLTIRQITARAGVGYATFFRHYPTKEALLNDVASEEISGLLAMTTPIFLESRTDESTRALCAHVARHRGLWSALLTGGAAGIVREEFVRQARAVDHATPGRASWLPADLAVVYGTGATIDLLAWWLAQEDDHAPDRIAAILDRLVIAPLLGTLGMGPEAARHDG
jgi:AcrR family transcriptional regulator